MSKPRLTADQLDYLAYLFKHGSLRGRGANRPCHRLMLLGFATVSWISAREYCYHITRAGQEYLASIGHAPAADN